MRYSSASSRNGVFGAHREPSPRTRPMMTASIPAVDPHDANDDSAAFLSALGKRVREGRERRGLSRKALSIEARVSERYLAQLEAGEGNVSIVLLRRVAAALGTTLLVITVLISMIFFRMRQSRM